MPSRAVLTVAIVAVLGALLGAGVGAYLAATTKPFYRATIELALLPGASVPPEQISNYWEALARGQAPRVAAEVLNQPRWKAAAAKGAGVGVDSITIDAGVVTDTTLITVGVGAPTATAAEQGVTAAVREATPLAQQVSGPFVLQVVQPADGTAKSLTTPGGQVVAISALAGLAVGAGVGVFLSRRAGGGSRQPAPAPPRPGPQAPQREQGVPDPRRMRHGPAGAPLGPPR